MFDVAAIRTRARRDDDCWVIDGQKVWTSLAQFSDWIFVLARTEAERQAAIETTPARKLREVRMALTLEQTLIDQAKRDKGLDDAAAKGVLADEHDIGLGLTFMGGGVAGGGGKDDVGKRGRLAKAIGRAGGERTQGHNGRLPRGGQIDGNGGICL